ncbi:MAG: MFS transporter [Nitrospinaceae bacterium]|jgi:MFS transporter, CP family, cyanate transporter|nr:MFS transporter [Nitrospinaceae bacterium]MBT3432370.1 MFS transporter [Nitrospinaceae bacterium]MBT4092700.1 MFS transporter [Nitrospinaceae bacterium]MBT5948224.1 MFS transporter [Nitrospinaceae bacterium]MBT6396352.1 MFS transporter [Nitrospinaceae bacterium]
MTAKASSRWYVTLMAACFLTWSVFGSLVSTSGLVELIRGEMGLSYSEGGFLLSVPFPLITLFALMGGVFVDRLGVQRMARLGALLVLAGGLLRVWSWGYWQLVIGIALVGAGAGLIFPVLPKVARETAPPDSRETAAAFYTAAVVTGAAMGVAFSGFMASILPSVPFVSAESSWRGGYLIWACALFVTFIVWERVGSRSLAEIGDEESGGGGESSFSPWRSRTVWAVTAALFVNNVLFYTGIGWFPSILESKGWGLGQAALIVSFVAWLGIIAVLTAHKISPLVGGIPRMVMICVLLIVVILVALPPSGRWAAAFGIVLIGFAMNFWFVLCMGYPARAVPAASVGQAGGMIIGLGYFGGFVGPWAAGAIRDAAGDFGPALYAMAALTLVSLLTAQSFGRPAE